MPPYRSSQGGPGAPPRSRSCAGGRHADCGHLLSVARRWGARPALLLCLCTCHSECPLADRLPFVTRDVWQAQCRCPGASLAADKLDEAERDAPDFAEAERRRQESRANSERESQQRRAARHEAFEAARDAATGKDRLEIRELFVAELRARGLTIPSDLVLDAFADAIARNREKFSLVYSIRVLAEMGQGFMKDMGQDFRRIFQGPDPR
jgi:hypothetical protein